jgi:hypothetical protein
MIAIFVKILWWCQNGNSKDLYLWMKGNSPNFWGLSKTKINIEKQQTTVEKYWWTSNIKEIL